MEQSVSIVLVGIGGYGNNYLKVLWEESMFNRIQGVVDIAPENSDYYEQLKEADVPVFSSMEAFYEKHEADMAVISTPIHFHTAQTICALENGSHVLCEKPMTPSLEDAETIIRLKKEKNAFVAVGFDWSFSRIIQQVKQDVLSGRFGEARRMKTLALWPRTEAYYERASWAGKKYAADRTPIFDSVVNNATSHFLHNMFYILGSRAERSAPLKELTAELYRANDIETFDTCALKGETEGGVPIYFLASHAVTEEIGPVIRYEFEHAVLTYVHHEQELKAEFTDGTVVTYGNPENERSFKLYHCMEAVQEQRTETLCGPEAALSHLHAINALHESVPEAQRFPEEIAKYDPDTRLHYVEGLDELLTQCYEDWQLPSEKGAAWTRQGRTISIPASSLSQT